MTLSEVLATPGGRVMLLQCVIEEMQEELGKLSENRPFVKAALDALESAGTLTEERLQKRGEIVQEKIARCEPPFDRPFFLFDSDAPDDAKCVFWPVQALERAMKAMDEGVFIPPK
jgi:hypothetical protein